MAKPSLAPSSTVGCPYRDWAVNAVHAQTRVAGTAVYEPERLGNKKHTATGGRAAADSELIDPRRKMRLHSDRASSCISTMMFLQKIGADTPQWHLR